MLATKRADERSGEEGYGHWAQWNDHDLTAGYLMRRTIGYNVYLVKYHLDVSTRS